MSRFLIVDDDARVRSSMVRALSWRGHEVTTAEGFRDARAAMLAAQQDVVVIDLRLGGEWGLEVLRELRAVDGRPRFVILTGFGAIPDAVEAMRLGASDFLCKPIAIDTLEELAGGGPLPPGEHEPPSLARVEWEHIRRVLDECDGNVSQAARTLGVHRRSLQRKLRRIPPPK